MHILIVDDDKNIRESLQWLLESEGHEVSVAATGEEGVRLVHKERYDTVFLDVMMPGMGGMKALERMRELDAELKVFMISGQADITVAVRATKLGAYDFFEKPLNPEKVLLEIKKLIEQRQIQAKVSKLEELIDIEYKMIGESQPMQELRNVIQQAAPSEGRILIYGENGTGKELVAREIHKNSLRSKRPFIQLNCAAIPGDLIESELFGYEKGAFTGAHRRKMGLIEQAEGGTLMLDEVGDMALETQAKLLRVLQENEFYRVGSTKAIKFDVRIIAATNKDLAGEIKAGHFRQDLYFRLNVIPIYVPPLRDRKEDIPALVDYFLKSYSRKNGKKAKTMSGEGISLLKGYKWPGNVRELGNIMERLAIMIEGEQIGVDDVARVIGSSTENARQDSTLLFDDHLPLKDQIQHYEKSLLLRVFERNDGNVSRMAAELKTDRANLHKKLKNYGIKD
jgi:two-component system nitrogen regulation response regulator NtrX